MKKREIGFGIVGCGIISRAHAIGIMKSPNAKLIALFDTKEEPARKFSKECKGIDYYTDYDKFLSRDDIDTVCICTPSGLHAEAAIPALQKKKHVLCEKPIEVTLEKIDRMIKVARENKVKLGVIFQRRTMKAIKRIKQALEEGEIGRLILATLSMKLYRSQEYYDSATWRGTWKLDGGGCLMNQGIHGIDLFQWLAGEKIECISAKTGTLAHKRIEVEDIALAMLRFKNNALGMIECSTVAYPGDIPMRFAFHGTKGTIAFECSEGMDIKITTWSIINEPDKNIDIKEEREELIPWGEDKTPVSARGHIIQIADFAEAILNNRDPLVSGEEGRKSVEIILNIYKSGETGKEVKIG